LKLLVIETERAWQAQGNVHYGAGSSEQASLRFRRSLCVVNDMRVGDLLSEDNIRAIRPGLGLPPKYLGQVLGRRAKSDVARGTPLSWDLLE